MTVVTRFAPSPTGFLHIGSARTALFNWLYAQHHGGKFLIRIEDTDQARSTQEAVDVIYKGLEWLGLSSPHPTYLQSQHAGRHREVALQMLEQDKAYRCYCTPAELEEMREQARLAGQPTGYTGKCRQRQDHPENQAYVVRLKAPVEGKTIVEDLVQGQVVVENQQLDDMVLLRSDGTPTYILAVVVDDHDMGITHVIRGDDHLTNTFRQYQIYQAMGWKIPQFAHIPLIHGQDGKKLSKRHGAIGIDVYQQEGFLPEALSNYLLRLGWGHGDAEIISHEQAIAWFDLPGVGKSAARFDMDKLLYLNAHYLKQKSDIELVTLLEPYLKERLGASLTDQQRHVLEQALPGIKPRAKTLVEMAEMAAFYISPRPIALRPEAQVLLTSDLKGKIKEYAAALKNISLWNHSTLESIAREFCAHHEMKLGQLAQPLRAAITGSTVSPGIFEVMEVLGKDETLGRLEDSCQGIDD